MPRTTNSAKSWHNQFQRALSTRHPNPYKLVDGLLAEHIRADFLWLRLEGGDVPVLYGDVSAREENKRLLNVIADYKEGSDLGALLKKCSQVIHIYH